MTTGDGAPGGHTWSSFFNDVPGTATPNSMDKAPFTTWTQPKAFLDRTSQLMETVDNVVRNNIQQFYTTLLLPMVPTKEQRWQWNEFHFNHVMPNATPELAPSRLVTSQDRQFQARTIRRGLAIEIEHGFLGTEIGLKRFRKQLQGILQSVQEADNHDVVEALLSARNYDREWNRMHGRYAVPVRELMAREVWEYGIIMQTTNGASLLTEKYKESAGNHGVTLDTLLVPTGAPIYMTMVKPEDIYFYLGGVKAPENMRMGPKALGSFRGSTVFESRAFDVVPDGPPIDLLRRPRQTGSVAFMLDDYWNQYHPDYQSFWRDVILFDESIDNWCKITMKEALAHCGRFNKRTAGQRAPNTNLADFEGEDMFTEWLGRGTGFRSVTHWNQINALYLNDDFLVQIGKSAIAAGVRVTEYAPFVQPPRNAANDQRETRNEHREPANRAARRREEAAIRRRASLEDDLGVDNSGAQFDEQIIGDHEDVPVYSKNTGDVHFLHDLYRFGSDSSIQNVSKIAGATSMIDGMPVNGAYLARIAEFVSGARLPAEVMHVRPAAGGSSTETPAWAEFVKVAAATKGDESKPVRSVAKRGVPANAADWESLYSVSSRIPELQAPVAAAKAEWESKTDARGYYVKMSSQQPNIRKIDTNYRPLKSDPTKEYAFLSTHRAAAVANSVGELPSFVDASHGSRELTESIEFAKSGQRVIGTIHGPGGRDEDPVSFDKTPYVARTLDDGTAPSEMAARTVANFFLESEINAEMINTMISNNVRCPVGVMLVRAFWTHDMYSFVYMRRGLETGATFAGHNDFQIANEVQTKKQYGHYTYNSKAVVYNPANVYVARDVYYANYVGGGDCVFIEPNHDPETGAPVQTDLMAEDEVSGSILSFIIPACGVKYENPMSITGKWELPQATNTIETQRSQDQAQEIARMNGGNQGRDLTKRRKNIRTHYATAVFYTWLWMLDVLADDARSRAEREADEYSYFDYGMRNTTVVYQDHQMCYKRIAAGHGDFNRVIINTGHHGPNVYPGCGKVRKGEVVALKEIDYGDKTVPV
jgi:hypothetical protein